MQKGVSFKQCSSLLKAHISLSLSVNPPKKYDVKCIIMSEYLRKSDKQKNSSRLALLTNPFLVIPCKHFTAIVHCMLFFIIQSCYGRKKRTNKSEQDGRVHVINSCVTCKKVCNLIVASLDAFSVRESQHE